MSEQAKPTRPTVSFTPPSDSAILTSTSPTPRQPSPTPPNTVPYPTEPSTKPKTFHLPGRKSNSPTQSRPTSPLLPSSEVDLERQPLLGTVNGSRRKVHYPLIVGIFMSVIIIIALGYGGLMLGRGEGDDRWPGGPHRND